MYGRPSKNIFLGRATSKYHALMRIKTGARQKIYEVLLKVSTV